MKPLDEAIHDFVEDVPDDLWLKNCAELSVEIRSNPDFERLMQKALEHIVPRLRRALERSMARALSGKPADAEYMDKVMNKLELDVETVLVSMFQSGYSVSTKVWEPDIEEIR